MTTRPTGRQRGRPPYPLLTPAEERVLKFIREGKTNAEIGVRLGVSPDAVKYHVSNMLGKLELSSREELAGWKPSAGNPLGRLWSAIPLFGKLGLGAGAAAVAGGVAWVAVTSPAQSPALYDGLVTVGYDGKPANGMSSRPQISGDGRYVAFQSLASNLVSGDDNGTSDVFRYDRKTREVELVSRNPVAPTGVVYSSFGVSMSTDGRFVAFAQTVADPAAEMSIVLRDMESGDFRIVASGVLMYFQALSGDGKYLAFAQADGLESRPKGSLVVVEVSSLRQVFKVSLDRERDPFGMLRTPSFSPDGRWFVFTAGVIPEVPQCEPVTRISSIDQEVRDVPVSRPFVHDMESGSTTCAPFLVGSGVDGQPMDTGDVAVTNRGLVYTQTLGNPLSGRLGRNRLVRFDPKTRAVVTEHLLDGNELASHGLAAAEDGTVAFRSVTNGGEMRFLTPGAGITTYQVDPPDRFGKQNLDYDEPVFAGDTRSLAFTVGGIDKLSGSQVSDVYVTSR